jgi:hydrogenase maturation protein HypF
VYAEQIEMGGIVQGVGFRPTVYRIAQELQLGGVIFNSGRGVVIRVAGTKAKISTLVAQIQAQCPPLARIDTVERSPLPAEAYGDARDWDGFRIDHSQPSEIHTQVSPDAAICPSCQRDLFDPTNRFYRYPFVNCTHCGPRLSVIRGLPYDRAQTSMARFALCQVCAQSYDDPSDRRFHAQPIACATCGPRVWIERADGGHVPFLNFSAVDETDAIATLLQWGQIVAIKGLGGFHLACDATNETAVQTLRDRKHRPHKPLALMARDLEVVTRYCQVSAAERQLLLDPAAPIVLLRAVGPDWVAPSVAPGLEELGMMLPYTPLHRLIMQRLDHPIVLTSGNHSHEPQCIDNEMARSHLGSIADYLLMHDRDIVNRVDDSVARVVVWLAQPQTTRDEAQGPRDPDLRDPDLRDPDLRDPGPRDPGPRDQPIDPPAQSIAAQFADSNLSPEDPNESSEEQPSPATLTQLGMQVAIARQQATPAIAQQRAPTIQLLRRARGYAPASITLPPGFEQAPTILALGSELKNTFCLIRDGQAILSQHLGDLQYAIAAQALEETLWLYLTLFDHHPQELASDAHPQCAATQLGRDIAEGGDLPFHAIQHHHAHIAACLADNRWSINAPPVLGIALDGFGWGDDGMAWGGEFLVADYRDYQRVAAFKPVPLLGGDKAALEPWRNAYGHLWTARLLDQLPPGPLADLLAHYPTHVLDHLCVRASQPHSTQMMTSSVGRLFDAVAALVGLPCAEGITYEGQAAIALESLAQRWVRAGMGSPWEVVLKYADQDSVVHFEATGTGTDCWWLDPAPLWRSLLLQLQAGDPPEAIAAYFHDALVRAMVQTVRHLANQGIPFGAIALSGGVFQNQYLLTRTQAALTAAGWPVLVHHHVPTNDGGISLGQGAIAAARAIAAGRGR